MAGGVDFASLRNQTLASGNDEEAVTVNTRALIDKVLARYSGEWTTLRELLQNAADAQATTVKIRFETLPSAQVPLSNTTNQSEILKHVLLNHTLSRMVVSNDGQPFAENDWTRLKRIAEGNPDETKIGAFGVGFYSVFADCEDPFVSSGSQAMAFYWKGNSLFTRRLQLPAEKGSKDTSFVLDYRNKSTPVPSLISLAQFLATSMTFVALQNIELWLDDWKIITLQKKVAPSQEVSISRDVETRTQEKHMKVQSVEKESVQMDASFMNVISWKPTATVSRSTTFQPAYGSSKGSVNPIQSFFAKFASNPKENALKQKAEQEEKALQDAVLEDLTALSTAHVFLRVTTARIETFLSKEFAAELERATKKPPPKKTKLAILTSSYDDTTASESKAGGVAKSVDLFSSVLPSKVGGGRVFIGFPTQQTTGAGFHISAPSVIPTVERESIDLNARWVNIWNHEMLRVAGILSRLAFTGEMAELGEKLKRAAESAGNGKKITKEIISQFVPEAIHTLDSFSFRESTPSYKVGACVEEAFWKTSNKPYIEVFSSRGVLLTRDVRLATEDLSGFVDGIPVVPEELMKTNFVAKLKSYGLLEEMGVSDVKKELEMKALTVEQLMSFISWAGKKAVTGQIDRGTMNSILQVAVATVPGATAESSVRVISLGSIKNYLSPSKIPAEIPVTHETIPFQFTKKAPVNELNALGWVELEIVPWLIYLIESQGGRNGLTADQDLTKTPSFAAQVLAVLSKQFDSLSPTSKATVVSLLQYKTVIPTKHGMRKPNESYFSSVKLFDDLPTVSGCPGVKEKFLSALGVRKTVELETIFTRLLSPSEDSNSKWSHVDLIKYLCSVQNDIPSDDIERLKETPICPAESSTTPGQGTARLYMVQELFEPKAALRDLELPTLYWSDPKRPYSPTSTEGKFLSFLGLRSFPSVPELVKLMASTDYVLRNKAMNYFIVSHEMNGYFKFSLAGSTAAFVPLEGNPKRLVSPAECFTNERATVLGFDILRADLHSHSLKFGVAQDPPITTCVNRLVSSKIPQNISEARILFTYFAGRLNELGPNNIGTLADALIVPVVPTSLGSGKSSQKFKYISPRSCFLGHSTTYEGIFDFVDFGDQANRFLLTCGAKHEPSKFELASMMVNNPAHLVEIFADTEKYLGLLRNLAEGIADLKRDKNLYKQMRTAPWLLATKEIPAKSSKGEKQNLLDAQEDLEDADDESGIKQWVLVSPAQIVIVDDFSSYRLFKDALCCAPQEDALEEFYSILTVPSLGSLVREHLAIAPPVDNHPGATKLQNLILERTKIFLHDHPSNAIKHDSKWLEKNLTVKVTKKISLTRSLRGYPSSHTENRTAAIQFEQGKNWFLYVTSSYDMFQISQALIPLLMNRPKTAFCMILDMLLSSELLRLKARGYNVDRILRAKAAEARQAEVKRQKEVEAEQRRIQESKQNWDQHQAATAALEGAPKGNELAMPGAFGNGDSPESSPKSPKPGENRKSRGLFSELGKRLGLDKSSETMNSPMLPPAYDEAVAQGEKETKKPEDIKKVTSPYALHQNLVNAVQASRAHNSNKLFSPPTTNQVKETASYCDNTPGSNITYLADASNGMRIFVAKDLSIPGTQFLADNVNSLNIFAARLFEISDVFNMPRSALHIFMDEKAATIAFNSGGSLFCNFKFFDQLLHSQNRSEALVYWFVTIAHELAHNIEKSHNAQHSFYTESFIQQYFPKAVTVFYFYGTQGNGAVLGDASGSATEVD